MLIDSFVNSDQTPPPAPSPAPDQPSNWMQMPRYNVDRIPDYLPIGEVVAFNVEWRSLYEHSVTWGDFNTTTEDRKVQKCLLYILAKAVSTVFPRAAAPSRRGDGSSAPAQPIFDPLAEAGYYIQVSADRTRRAIPKVSVLVEKLVDEQCDSKGWRFWIVGHTPEFDMGTRLFQSIAGNRQADNRRRNRDGTSVNVGRADCWRTMRIPNQYMAQIATYYEGATANRLLNPIRGLQMQNPLFSEVNHPFNPINIFSPANAMVTHVQDVCEAQRNLASYVTMRAGQVVSLRFPRPARVWTIPLINFEPQALHILAIPRPPNPGQIHDLPPLEEVPPAPGDDSSMDGAEGPDLFSRLTGHAEAAMERRVQQMIAQGIERDAQTPRQNSMRVLSESDRAIIDRSFLLVQRQEFLPKKKELRRTLYAQAMELPSEDPSRPLLLQEYRTRMLQFKQTALRRWWREMESCTIESAHISQVVKAGINFFQSVDNESLYPERNQTYKRLSLYGNMRVGIHIASTRIHRFKNGATARRFYQLHLACVSAFQFSYDLHINILVEGASTVGKSYLMDAMMAWCFRNSCIKTTRLSKLVFTSDEDWNDVCLVIHEAPGYLIGVDEHGKITSGDEVFKDRMTSNLVRTFRLAMTKTKNPETDEESSSSKRVCSVSRCMGNCIMSTNTKTPPNDHPVMTRFLRDIVTAGDNRSKCGFDLSDIAFPLTGEEDVENNAVFLGEEQILHTYTMLVEKAMEAGILDDVNTNIASIMFRRVFGRLHEVHGMPKVGIRTQDQMMQLCRIAAIRLAIYTVITTEGSPWRVDGHGRPRAFDPMCLLDIERYLVVTEEIVADVLSLFQNTFVPLRSQKLINACKALIPGNPLPRVYRDGRGVPFEDKNYVQFSYGTVGQFCDAVSDRCGQILSVGLVNRLLTQLSKEFLYAQDRNVESGVQGDRIRLKIALIEDDPDRGKHGKKISIAHDRLFQKFREDALEESIIYALSYQGCRPRTIITSFRHHLKFRNSDKIHYFEQYLHPLRIRPTEEVLVLRNHMSYRLADYATLYNRARSGATHTRSRMEMPAFIATRDLEIDTFRSHWNQIGAEFCQDLLPWQFKSRIWEYRRRHPEIFAVCREFEFDSYPGDLRREDRHTESLQKTIVDSSVRLQAGESVQRGSTIITPDDVSYSRFVGNSEEPDPGQGHLGGWFSVPPPTPRPGQVNRHGAQQHEVRIVTQFSGFVRNYSQRMQAASPPPPRENRHV